MSRTNAEKALARCTDEERAILLGERGLTERHLAELVVESAIAPRDVIAAGFFGIHDAKTAQNRTGRPRKVWDSTKLPAWCVPYAIPGRQDPVLFQTKPATPFERKQDDGEVKLDKYVQPKNSGTNVFWNPLLLTETVRTDASVPIAATEGVKKAMAANSAGIPCFALNGVSAWHVKGSRALHPHLLDLQLEGRTVYVIFDADSLEKHQVREQETDFGRVLERAGAKVFLVRLPKSEPKLDDFLAAHEVSELHVLFERARQYGQLPPDTCGAVHAPADGTDTTDLDNAQRFVKAFGDEVRYCHQLGRWFFWDGSRWAVDEKNAEIPGRAHRTAHAIYEEAAALSDPEQRMAMARWAQKTKSRDRLGAMVDLARTFAKVSVRLADFDADPWLLNVRNGLLDLRTGELRAHDRAAMCTRIAPVFYDPKAKDERWDKYLEHVSGGSQEVERFLASAVGYSLTGDTSEIKFFSVDGIGGGGKSTFIRALKATLGEYCVIASTNSFLQSRHDDADRPRSDLVSLQGARIVMCEEVNSGAHLDGSLIKRVTGGVPIKVRTLHKEPFEMPVGFKLWLVYNETPSFQGEDTGLQRRVLRIQFDRKFHTPDLGFQGLFERDATLRSAVLAWAVRGLQAWRTNGLVPPQEVERATGALLAEMDPAGDWVERFCRFELGVTSANCVLRQAYEEWCRGEGLTPLGPKRFWAGVRKHAEASGFEFSRTCVRHEGKPVDGRRHVRLATAMELETAAARSSTGDGVVDVVDVVVVMEPRSCPPLNCAHEINCAHAVHTHHSTNSAESFPLLTTDLQANTESASTLKNGENAVVGEGGHRGVDLATGAGRPYGSAAANETTTAIVSVSTPAEGTWTI